MKYQDLNEQQQKALLKIDGPLLILAGAGSGKTKVVTNKIAYLIENTYCNPSEILAITFTNKAAKEMKDRVSNLIDVDVSLMWIGTFHSICIRVLRSHINRIGYDSNFTIYDRDDQKTLIKDIIKDLGISTEMYKPTFIISKISSLKNEFISPKKFISENSYDFYNENVGKIYDTYERRMRENSALDFDDLILKTIEILENHETVKESYRNKFKYIFVDEYQDTNVAQYRLIKLFCRENPNLTVVGDNDQSIYKWRGADITNILNFEKDFKGAEVILLEENYRSTSKILNAANTVIRKNSNRRDKNLWTRKKDGEDVLYKLYGYSSEESQGVINKILGLNYKGEKFSDMAILYRTNAQSRAFEEALMRERIPYNIVGGLKFYDRKEVKDIVAYLKVLQNIKDDVSLKRIINVPKRGIGAASIGILEEYGRDNQKSILEVILNLENEDLNLRGKKNLLQFSNLISLLLNKKEELPISELIREVIHQSEYVSELEKENTIEAKTRIENINEFVSTAVDYEKKTENGTLEDFLSGISLLSDVDKTDEKIEGVKLMTIHGSKGLEFPIVFLVGMEEGLFPSSMAEEDGDIEEERRLCYVAITRAERLLFISGATTRTIYGNTKPSLESRFIKELGDSIVIEESKKKFNEQKTIFKDYTNKKTFTSSFAKKLEDDNKKEKNTVEVNLGDKVIHKKWGEGMIVQKIEKNGDHEIAIAFDGKGIKKFMLSLAPISVVK